MGRLLGSSHPGTGRDLGCVPGRLPARGLAGPTGPADLSFDMVERVGLRWTGHVGRASPAPAPFRSIPRPARTRIRPVADPVTQGRSVVVEAIRSLAIACRAWAAYPSD